MQRRFFSAKSSRVSAALRHVAPCSLLTPQQFQSTAAINTGVESGEAMCTDASAPSGSSSSSGDASRLQQLYKSSHKGRGNTPIPKPHQERKLRPRHASAGAAVVDPSPPPLFGSRSSCSEDAGPVAQRTLSPLQKRQLQLRNKAAFVLTPQALRRVKFLLDQYTTTHPAAEKAEKSGDAARSVKVPRGIRIGVRRRGCSGYSYTVNYFFEPASSSGANDSAAAGASAAPARKKGGFMEDVVVEQDGVKVVVDGDALFYVIGTEMDYVVRNVEEKFTFKNPNQKYGCGCEESFMPFDGDDEDDD